ncbi:MAG TPA: hypothetical protein VJ888_04625 [Mobilitalea sp.]|nr:hypothetical protein [Mobilitalea sp.]
MKKIIALLISLTLVMTALAGCSNNDKKAEAAKTGLAVISSVAKSAIPGEKDGLAEVDSTAVAVLVDKDGKIVKCSIDVAQTKINFSAEGKILTDLATVFKSKQELKEEYGMLKQSGIGKEWYQQADEFEKYVIGKTVAEVKGIAIDAEGKATDADLSASVTVHINEFIEGVEKAVVNAQDLGAKTTDKLGLGVSTTIAKSTDATAEKAGLAQAYSFYTVVTTDAKGKITSSFVDASQSNVNFDTTGAITTDLTAPLQTKQELKEAYDMKGSSDIGKEWYEQANAFSKYVTGKTVAEVDKIAITADGLAGDADLIASITVHIGDFITGVKKAVANAQ